MTETAESPVKVAISYSWTSRAHRTWVESLADRLLDTEIDVVLDVYNFKHGINTIAFMQKFVDDPTISKVLCVCDCLYAQKANEYRGGVGIESQIISPEVYADIEQTKFIPIVREFDAERKPCLPTYLKGRFYVDLSSDDTFEEGYAELVNSIHDRPLRKKPKLGKRPSYLDEEGEPRTSTYFKSRTLIDAVINSRPTMAGMLVDYLSVLSDALHEKLKPLDAPIHPREIASAVRQTAAPLLPYKSEFVDVMTHISKYGAVQNISVLDALHDFFVGLLPFMRPDRSTDPSFDPGRFVTYELFLNCIAVLLKHNKFDEAAYLLEQEYLDPVMGQRYASLSRGLSNFNVLDGYLRSFELEGQQGGSWNPLAAFLFERAKDNAKLLTTDDLVNADVALYCRGFSTAATEHRWWCRTLSPAYGVSPTPIFRKAAAKSFFERFKRVLNIESAPALRDLLASLEGKGKLDSLMIFRMTPYESHARLFALDDLASR